MSAPTSEIPVQEHPWARRYAEQGRERPQLIEFKKSTPGPKEAPAVAPVSAELAKLAKSVWDEPPPEVELVNAARLAEIAAEIEARRRRDRAALWRLLGVAAAAVVAVIVAVEAWQFFGNDRPPEERLASVSNDTAAQVLQTLGAAGMPLAIERVEMVLARTESSSRSDYDAVVTLRLQENLYGPAESNGAQAYLLLQRSVAEAGDLMRKSRLYLSRPDLSDPVAMPLLLAITHRAGEQLVVRVPLKAERVGWRWQLEVRSADLRADGAMFAGRKLSDFADQSVLIFGTKEARERMRPLMQEARRFVLAVKEAASGRAAAPMADHVAQ